MQEAQKIIKSIQSGQFAPIYFLHGEEAYYIDLIANLIEGTALDEAAKGFDQTILYGKEVRIGDVIGHARRFPMMGQRQVVIVKEAQNIIDLTKENGIRYLTQYLKKPLPSTILVFCYKHGKLDKRKSLWKALEEYAVCLTSNKIYDNQVPDWVRAYVQEKQFEITNKAAHMLAEFIGNNLERLSNEINKILINYKEKVEIDDVIVQKYVGISKEYNAFELQKAVAYGELIKANKIVRYFEANPKANPVIPAISVLYLFFAKVLVLHATTDKSEQNLSSVLKTNRYFVRDYLAAGRNYPLQKVINIMHALRHADLQSKGVLGGNMPGSEILKELIFKMMH
jgi:DNA polymerase-3 subunit delta